MNSIIIHFSFIFDFNGLVSMFDIFKQFRYIAKRFVNTCKSYKYAKFKTSSLQNFILHKRKINKISHESNSHNSSVGEPDMTF